MRKLLLVFILSSALSLFSQSYEAPLLHCLQVDASDDVTLTWQAPVNSSGAFVEYRLWRREQFSDAALSTIPNILTTSFLDLGASANELERYFVEAVYDSLGFEVIRSSALLETINPSPVGLVNKVLMDWNQPIESPGDSIYSSFIFQLNYNGTWISADTLPYSDTSYVYFSEVCPLPPALEVDIDFRVLLLDMFGCTSVSILQDNVTPLVDNNPPTPPVIETVSVDTASQNAVVCWFPSPEGDVEGYRIQTIDEIDVGITADPNILSYTVPGSDVLLNSQGYFVLARDTCSGAETTADECIPHYTMRLEIEYEKCNQRSIISWNPYINWEGGVKEYIVYGGLTGTPLVALDTLGEDVTNFVHEEVPLDVDFEYLVKAESNNGFKPSLSPKTRVITNYPDLPDYSYLANVSVAGNNAIELKALVEPAADRTRYRFERLDRFGDLFTPLTTVNQDQADADGYIYAYDFDVNTTSNLYTYRFTVIDSCGNEYNPSNVSNNIRLSVDVNSTDRENYIYWNPYEGWEGEVLAYNIYAVVNGVVGAQLGTVPSDVQYFTDQVDSVQDFLRNAQYCYVVEALESIPGLGVPQSSFSNVICGTQEPDIWIPNAFTPNGDGINDEFRPKGGYLDRAEGYSMQIFDRWGKIVFETDDFYTAWKAERESSSLVSGNSDIVQEGTYVYLIRFITGDGTQYERYGNISVILPSVE